MEGEMWRDGRGRRTWERRRPERRATDGLRLDTRPMIVTMMVLMKWIARPIPTMSRHEETASFKSMEKPVVMKKRPRSSPRKGAMSASIW